MPTDNSPAQPAEVCCGWDINRDYEVSADGDVLRCPDCSKEYKRSEHEALKTVAQPAGYQRRQCSKCGEGLGFSEDDPCDRCAVQPAGEGGAPELTLQSGIFPNTGQAVPVVGDVFVVTEINPDALDLHDGLCTVVTLVRAPQPATAPFINDPDHALRERAALGPMTAKEIAALTGRSSGSRAVKNLRARKGVSVVIAGKQRQANTRSHYLYTVTFDVAPTAVAERARRAVQALDDAGYLDEAFIAEMADNAGSDRQTFFETCKAKMADIVAAEFAGGGDSGSERDK